MREVASKLQNSLFFSLLAGNWNAETGSITTASATTHSGHLRICRDLRDVAAFSGHSCCRFWPFSLCRERGIDLAGQSLPPKFPFLGAALHLDVLGRQKGGQLSPVLVHQSGSTRSISVRAALFSLVEAGPAVRTGVTTLLAHRAKPPRQCRGGGGPQSRP